MIPRSHALRRLRFAVAAAAGVGVLAGGATAAATVNVKLSEYKVVVSTATVKAGKVTFVAKNAGKFAHQFVVLKTARAPDKLPQNAAFADERGRVGSIETFAPGKTRRLTLTLEPGKYVLICNVSFHYRNGQRTAFTVT